MTRRNDDRRTERGTILLVVVFIATAVAALAAISSGRVVTEIRAHTTMENETRAYNEAFSQLHMALNIVNSSPYNDQNQNLVIRDALADAAYVTQSEEDAHRAAMVGTERVASSGWLDDPMGLNDSVTPDAAKRLYGLVGLGGVTGGVFGTTAMRSLIATIDPAGWLWICVGLGVLILLVAAVAGRLVATQPPPAARQEAAAPALGNPALEGARLVSRSPYLLSIVGIVGLYEIVSTVLDFQFTSTIAHYLDGAAIGRQFSTVFLLTNIVSLVVQLFLTSLVMTRFGVGIALLVLPLAILLGSTGFMVVPILWIGSLLNTLDNGFSYSINQSAKEALYVPTSTDEKYKAKAFIDMFVQRFAKALAVAVSLGLTAIFSDFASLRWLSVFTIGIIVVWIIAVRYAGKRFQVLTVPTEVR